MNVSPELFVTLPNRVRICYQTFGDPSDPAVILVPGNAGSMLDWPEDLIKCLNSAGGTKNHFFIRYDPRDTGLSTEFPVPAGYSLGDMAGDVEGLAEHLGLCTPSKGFHVIGISKGGPVAYIVAARRPQHVRSLALMLTSPGISPDLPQKEGLDLGFLPFLAGSGNEKEMHVKYSMTLYDALTTQPTEEGRKEFEASARRIVEREMKSGTLYSKGPNHGMASHEGEGWPGVETLKKIKSPTLVIQAAKDQIFGEIHGEALASAIPGAEYVLWDDIGHEMPRRIWGRMAQVLQQIWAKGESEEG